MTAEPKKLLKRAGEHPVADMIREHIGAGPEEVEIVTPQFTRTQDDPAPLPCPDADVFARLHTMSPPELRELGLRPWNDPANPDPDDADHFGTDQLWLLPGEWYDGIPRGLPVVTITGRRESFEPGVAADDIRYGCLPYGVLVRPKGATDGDQADHE